MNAFQRIERDFRQDQVDREMLLAQPPEFFRAALGGSPSPSECIHLVETLVRTLATLSVYVNDTYRVRIRKVSAFVHLSIGRHDGQPCTNWRDFQRIKNELVGPECEAVELFPAESRLMDTANEYHLYVVPDANYRFPFGVDQRLVLENTVLSQGPAGKLANRGDCQPVSTDSAATALSRC